MEIIKQTETFVAAQATFPDAEFFSAVDKDFACEHTIAQRLLFELIGTTDVNAIILLPQQTCRVIRCAIVAPKHLGLLKIDDNDKVATASLQLILEASAIKRLKQEMHKSLTDNFAQLAVEKSVESDFQDRLDGDLMEDFNKHLVENNLVHI